MVGTSQTVAVRGFILPFRGRVEERGAEMTNDECLMNDEILMTNGQNSAAALVTFYS
jgi:hypothetical protein